LNATAASKRLTASSRSPSLSDAGLTRDQDQTAVPGSGADNHATQLAQGILSADQE
jgi:hypothetical protein